MSFKRRGTQFGPPSIREGTPDSYESGSGNESKKLKKRAGSAEDEEAPRKIRRFAPQAVHPSVRIQHSHPWQNLTKHFTLLLEDSLTIASRPDGLLVAVREFSGPDAERKFGMLQKIQRENFKSEDSTNILAFLECFSFGGSLFAVFEHEITRGEKLPVTLNHYALIKYYPTESQLAIILRQILRGLKYLASLGLEHGALTCKNILISTEGSIRIAGQECCREIYSTRGSVRDIRGVGYVTMELMQKEARYEGPIKVHDVSRWKLDSLAVQFLLVTESACSIEELEKHPLLTCERRQSDMVGIRANVYTAEFSVFRGHDIPPQPRQSVA